MGYAVAHVSKGSSSGGGLGNHIDRKKGKEYSFKNADPLRLKFNHNHKVNKYTQMPFNIAIEERIKDGYKSNRKLRTDAVKYCSAILSGSHEDMIKIDKSKEGINAWFQKNLEFSKKQWGAENIVRFVLHRDEKTPHIHCVFVPITPKGKLSAKEVIGNSKKLKEFQDSYAIEMKEFGLKRGLRGSGAKHETVKEYYARANNSKNPITEEKLKAYTTKIEKSILKPLKIDFLNLDKFQDKNEKSVKKAVSEIVTSIHKDYIRIENTLREKTKELARIKGHHFENVKKHKALNKAEYDVKYESSGVVFSSEGSELLINNDLIMSNLNTQKFDKDLKKERDRIKLAVINAMLNKFKKSNDLLTLSPKALFSAAGNILDAVSNYSDDITLNIRGKSVPLNFRFKTQGETIDLQFSSENFKGEPTSFTRKMDKKTLRQNILESLEHSQKIELRNSRKNQSKGREI